MSATNHTLSPADANSTAVPAGASVIKPNSKEALQMLTSQIESQIQSLGYEVVALELITQGERVLRLYIDFLDQAQLATPTKRISLDDCVAVNGAIDQLLDQTTLIEGSYNLEVSSPGIERPLRKRQDYERFKGRRARISTYRPLNSEELGDEVYASKNPKQKNFIGNILGVESDNVLFKPEGYKVGPTGQEGVKIPFDQITKAHLEFEET